MDRFFFECFLRVFICFRVEAEMQFRLGFGFGYSKFDEFGQFRYVQGYVFNDGYVYQFVWGKEKGDCQEFSYIFIRILVFYIFFVRCLLRERVFFVQRRVARDFKCGQRGFLGFEEEMFGGGLFKERSEGLGMGEGRGFNRVEGIWG